jgi:hypothetical protein
MSTPLLPQAFWFRLAIPCQRIDGIPRSGSRGRLLDLPRSCALPEFVQLDGREAWADVRVAWNSSGLAVAVTVEGKEDPISYDRGISSLTDSVQLWIDTRDTREIHRATRFCHHFTALLNPSGPRGSLGIELRQTPINRAQANAPLCQPESILARAESLRKGWRLELFLPDEVLNGFDPETNRRLGFAYQVTDAEREDQFLSVGREFPISEDPSLWSTLELREES